MNSDDNLGSTIRSALQARANKAPEALDLAQGARSRMAQRRRRRAVVATAASAVMVIGGVAAAGGWQAQNAANGPEPAPASGSSELHNELPDDWRWETYHGVRVGVPADWGRGTTGQPWCADVDNGRGPMPPYVGRPGGPVLAIACRGDGTTVDAGGRFLWFDDPSEPRDTPVVVAGDRATLTVAGVVITVQAPDQLRDNILATVQEVPQSAEEVVVPDVYGQPREAAEQVLTDAGLAVNVETETLVVGCVSRPCPDAGDVAAQSPVPGAIVLPGSIVTLTVLVAGPSSPNGCEVPHDTDGDGDVDGDTFVPVERVPDCYFVGEQAQPHEVTLYHCGVLPTTFLGERWEVPEEAEPFGDTNVPPAEFVGTGVMGLLSWKQAVYRDDSGIKIAFVPAEQVPPSPCR